VASGHKMMNEQFGASDADDNVTVVTPAFSGISRNAAARGPQSLAGTDSGEKCSGDGGKSERMRSSCDPIRG